MVRKREYTPATVMKIVKSRVLLLSRFCEGLTVRTLARIPRSSEEGCSTAQF